MTAHHTSVFELLYQLGQPILLTLKPCEEEEAGGGRGWRRRARHQVTHTVRISPCSMSGGKKIYIQFDWTCVIQEHIEVNLLSLPSPMDRTSLLR